MKAKKMGYISKTVLLMFMVAIVATLTTSCSKKPDVIPPPAPIIGTWSVSKIIDVENGNDVTSSRSCEAGAVSTFNVDGSFSSTDSACSLYVFSASWTLTVNQLVVTVNGIGVAWRGKVTFTSDNKNFSLDESQEKGYIYTFKKQ